MEKCSDLLPVLFSNFFLFKNLLCVFDVFFCLCLCTGCLWCCWTSEESATFHETGHTDGCESSCGCWESNPKVFFLYHCAVAPTPLCLFNLGYLFIVSHYERFRNILWYSLLFLHFLESVLWFRKLLTLVYFLFT